MRLFTHLATLFPQFLATLLSLDKRQLAPGSCRLACGLALLLKLLLPLVPELLRLLVRLTGFLAERFPLVAARRHFFQKILKIGRCGILDLFKDNQDLIFDGQRGINQGKLCNISLAKRLGITSALVKAGWKLVRRWQPGIRKIEAGTRRRRRRLHVDRGIVVLRNSSGGAHDEQRGHPKQPASLFAAGNRGSGLVHKRVAQVAAHPHLEMQQTFYRKALRVPILVAKARWECDEAAPQTTPTWVGQMAPTGDAQPSPDRRRAEKISGD
jgi:hypothetical protein